MKIKDFFYSTRDVLEKDAIPEDYWLERFRNWRNEELSKTDWTQLPDVLVDKDLWAEYRQILRDLPASEDFSNAELPEKP